MPIYTWRLPNTKTGESHRIEVLRPFDKYEEPPTTEEIAHAGLPDGCTVEGAERLIGLSNAKFAAGWGTGKGNRAKGGGH